MEQLYSLIRKYEGLRLTPYLCPAGIPTIGYGSTRYLDGTPVKMTDNPITEEEAEKIMRFTADWFASEALRVSPVLELNENHHAAIADFCYNLGVEKYKGSTLRKRIDSGDLAGARQEIRRWRFGSGKVLPGLVARRNSEAMLLV